MTSCPNPLHWTKVSTKMSPVTQVAEVAVKSAVRKPQDSPLREATGSVSKSAPVRMIPAKHRAMIRVVESRLELADNRSCKKRRTYRMEFPPKYTYSRQRHIRLSRSVDELSGSGACPNHGGQAAASFARYNQKDLATLHHLTIYIPKLQVPAPVISGPYWRIREIKSPKKRQFSQTIAKCSNSLFCRQGSLTPSPSAKLMSPQYACPVILICIMRQYTTSVLCLYDSMVSPMGGHIGPPLR